MKLGLRFRLIAFTFCLILTVGGSILGYSVYLGRDNIFNAFEREAIESAEGLEPVVELEATRGWEAAQGQVNTYLSDPDLSHLPVVLARHIDGLTPIPDCVFLWRAA